MEKDKNSIDDVLDNVNGGNDRFNELTIGDIGGELTGGACPPELGNSEKVSVQAAGNKKGLIPIP